MLFPVVVFASLALIQQAPAAGQTPPPAPAEAAVATLPTVNAGDSVAETTQVCRSSVQTAEERAASREMLRRMQGSRMPDGG